MASILFTSDNLLLADSYALAFAAMGHRVEVPSNAHEARDRFLGSPVDVVVIDVASPDGGCGIWVEQARRAWPLAKVVALTQSKNLRRTKFEHMGSWAPDLALVHPVPAPRLVSVIHQILDPEPVRHRMAATG